MPRSPRPARRSLTPHVTPLVAALCTVLLLSMAPALVPAASAASPAAAQVTRVAPTTPVLPRPAPVTGLVADLVGPLTGGRGKKIRVRKLLRTMLRVVNVARSVPQLCGTEVLPAAGPLKRNRKLNSAARKYARKMARNDWFEHDSPNGDDPGDRISAAGYTWSRWGENIGAGYDDVLSVVTAWLASPGHCKVLMSKFRHVGFGYAYHRKSTFGHYWVQDFARPRKR